MGEAQKRSLERGGQPVLFANWKTIWQDVVAKKFPESVDRFGHTKMSCIMIYEEVSVVQDNNQGFNIIHSWEAEKGPPTGFILSEVQQAKEIK